MKNILRRSGIAILMGGALLGCTALLGDFDVSGSPVGPGDPDGATDGTTPNADGSTDGSGADTGLVCNAPFVKCPADKVCAILLSDPQHCGECGHNCGGGVCENGVCKPFKLYDTGGGGTLTVGPIDVGEALLFFATTDGNMENKMLHCPLAGGCKAPPQQLATMQYSIDAIAAINKETFAFLSAPAQSTQRPAIYACTPAGCPSPPVSFTGDGLNGVDARFRLVQNRIFHFRGGSGIGFSNCPPNTPGTCESPATALGTMTRSTHGFTADATNVYFVDTVARLSVIAKCAQTDTACAPTKLVDSDHADVEGIEHEGGKLFWIKPGRDGFNEGKLHTCDLPACAAPKLVANGLSTSPNTPIGLRVDGSGAYWITTTNKIQRCAPNGCLGGAKDFVVPSSAPHSLVLDGKFVYWAEKTSIWRLAK